MEKGTVKLIDFIEGSVFPREYSPLALAYIGDSVYDLYIRSRVMEKGNKKITDLHKKSVSYVNASAQAQVFIKIAENLTDEEKDILKWGRNANNHTPPKNANVIDYRMATGFETLIGFLYMSKEYERLNEVLKLSYDILNNN